MGIKKVKRQVNGKPEWVFTYDFYLDGRRVRTPRDSYFPTRGECEDAVATIRADHRRGIYDFPADDIRVTLSEVALYVDETLTAEGKARPYIDRLTASLRVLEKAIPSHVTVKDLTTEHLELFVEAEIRRKRMHSTIRNKLNGLIVALNMAKRHFKPLAKWQVPARPRNLLTPDGGRDRIITEEEEEKIIAAYKMPCERNNPFQMQMRLQGARIFWLALRTGLREGEILALRKSAVHFERAVTMPHGYIHITATAGKEKTKTKRNRFVPMSASVAAALKEWIKESRSEFVFSSFYRRDKPVSIFRIGFKQAVRRAKLPYGRAVKGGIVFHDARHTAATRMLQRGASLRDVADILGHSDTHMTLRYVHSSPGSKQAAVDLLDNETDVRLASIAVRTERTIGT